ncbi:hypothetical protein QBC38DRAFT_488200 [Podospora fimiseda]|uniref:Uncharacterized protein n=1 Tax=Podospora fimiseda TaxID=252190 RepID=A0AAN7GNH6_9PEZI|nr:hypothetical protein QBC38DRAFT_488200 [Podospora fimiseda]
MSHKCQSKGCHNDVLYKTLDPGFDNNRHSRSTLSPSGRGSPPGSYPRYASPRAQVSSYCEVHTCSHFLKNESCPHKKPPHDSVCAQHARCPIGDCMQARAQYLDPNFDPMTSASPVYARYDVCPDHKCNVRQCPRRREPETPFCVNHGCQAEGCQKRRQGDRDACEDHQCKARSCRAITEGDYPYCAQHIKCAIPGCGGVKHFAPKTQEYLESCTKHITCAVQRCKDIKRERSVFCDGHTCNERDCTKSSTMSRPYCDEHRCTETSCPNPRPWAPNPKLRGRFCPLHTCRAEQCQEFVDSFAIFCQIHGCSKPKCHQETIVEDLCLDHLKHHYTTLGRRRATLKSQQHKPKQLDQVTPPPSNKLDESDSDSDGSELSHPVTDTSAGQRGRTSLRPGSTVLKPIPLATQRQVREEISDVSEDEDGEDARPRDLPGPGNPPSPSPLGSGQQGSGQRMSPVRKGSIEKPGYFARSSTGTLSGVSNGNEAAVRRVGSVRQQGGAPQPPPPPPPGSKEWADGP